MSGGGSPPLGAGGAAPPGLFGIAGAGLAPGLFGTGGGPRAPPPGFPAAATGGRGPVGPLRGPPGLGGLGLSYLKTDRIELSSRARPSSNSVTVVGEEDMPE